MNFLNMGVHGNLYVYRLCLLNIFVISNVVFGNVITPSREGEYKQLNNGGENNVVFFEDLRETPIQIEPIDYNENPNKADVNELVRKNETLFQENVHLTHNENRNNSEFITIFGDPMEVNQNEGRTRYENRKIIGNTDLVPFRNIREKIDSFSSQEEFRRKPVILARPLISGDVDVLSTYETKANPIQRNRLSPRLQLIRRRTKNFQNLRNRGFSRHRFNQRERGKNIRKTSITNQSKKNTLQPNNQRTVSNINKNTQSKFPSTFRRPRVFIRPFNQSKHYSSIKSQNVSRINNHKLNHPSQTDSAPLPNDLYPLSSLPMENTSTENLNPKYISNNAEVQIHKSKNFINNDVIRNFTQNVPSDHTENAQIFDSDVYQTDSNLENRNTQIKNENIYSVNENEYPSNTPILPHLNNNDDQYINTQYSGDQYITDQPYSEKSTGEELKSENLNPNLNIHSTNTQFNTLGNVEDSDFIQNETNDPPLGLDRSSRILLHNSELSQKNKSPFNHISTFRRRTQFQETNEREFKNILPLDKNNQLTSSNRQIIHDNIQSQISSSPNYLNNKENLYEESWSDEGNVIKNHNTDIITESKNLHTWGALSENAQTGQLNENSVIHNSNFKKENVNNLVSFTVISKDTPPNDFKTTPQDFRNNDYDKANNIDITSKNKLLYKDQSFSSINNFNKNDDRFINNPIITSFQQSLINKDSKIYSDDSNQFSLNQNSGDSNYFQESEANFKVGNTINTGTPEININDQFGKENSFLINGTGVNNEVSFNNDQLKSFENNNHFSNNDFINIGQFVQNDDHSSNFMEKPIEFHNQHQGQDSKLLRNLDHRFKETNQQILNTPNEGVHFRSSQHFPTSNIGDTEFANTAGRYSDNLGRKNNENKSPNFNTKKIVNVLNNPSTPNIFESNDGPILNTNNKIITGTTRTLSFPSNFNSAIDESSHFMDKSHNSEEKLTKKFNTDFSCVGRQNGLQADVSLDCQVFHFCSYNRILYSNICPPGTIFNQKFQVCDHIYSATCGPNQPHTFTRLF